MTAMMTRGRGLRTSAAGMVLGLMLMLCVWPMLALAADNAAAMNFPPLTGRVVDTAEMIGPATEATLTEDLAALERDKGMQFVIATIPSLHGQTIENYGYQLGRHWAIGRKKVDDGVILLVARDDRKLRIDVGYGLTPVLTSGLSGLIIQQAILPRFKQGDFSGGIKAGAGEIITQLRLPAPAAEARAKRIVAAQKEAEAQSAQMNSIFTFVFVAIVLFVLFRARRGMGQFYRQGGMPVVIWGPGLGSGGFGGGFGGGGFGGGGFGGGGFSGGGGSFGGGGASGGW
ncbi:TPM domain-containing protein [Aquisediminimonas sediminicola]|uniref:TPM domain-containing protein n=1 Tax=Alteraquisediminimonas sediminicola TaxID=2676787 RepID=UPI001FE55DCC|nr:TPM domain-containing protein [Aquisediminimonas sediminicola]